MSEQNLESQPDQQRKLPNAWWKRGDVISVMSEWFSHHTIALQVIYEVNDQLHLSLATGFLLCYQDVLMWVTAGHVLKGIGGLFTSELYAVRSTHWLDNGGPEGAKSIPVDFHNLKKAAEVNADFDIGVVAFGQLDGKAVWENCNNQWATDQIWKNNHLAKPDGFYLLGYPEEWSKMEISTIDGVYRCKPSGTFVCIPLERIEPKPAQPPRDFWDHPGWFYGRILPVTYDDGQQLRSIEGMSGGPIFSVEATPDRQFRYRLFAIQSSWLPESRILRATPIDRVVELMDKAYAQARKNIENG